jgi:hypothetical protein
MATLGEYIGAGSGTTKLLLHLNGDSTDSSGNANNGTDTNITYGLGYGKLGQGSHTTDGKISFGNPFIGDKTSNRTFSIWLRPTAASGDSLIFHTAQSNADGEGWTRISASGAGWVPKIFFFTGSATSFSLSSPTVLSLNVFYHIVCVIEFGVSARIYVNGSLVATGSLVGISSSYGAGASTVTRLFQNYINTEQYVGHADEAIVEKRVWSDTEIKKLYTFTRGMF